MAAADIIGLGEPLIEMVRMAEPIDGRPVYRQGFGGDTLNATVAAARQGARTGYVSAVGGDPFGEDILALCDAEGVDRSTVLVRPTDPTGVNFVHPDPSGRRFSYARRGSAASLFTADELPEAAIAGARILHVSAISQAISASMRGAVQRAAEIARANGTLVSYDLNLRLSLWTLDEARAAIEAFLPLADIVLPSDDEAEMLIGTRDPEAILGHFGRHGAAHVVLKRGEVGAMLAMGDARHAIPAPRVRAVDSTGAGDSFAGSFLAYLLEDGDALRAARLAARVAAGTVSGYGAIDPIPRRAEVLAGA